MQAAAAALAVASGGLVCAHTADSWDALCMQNECQGVMQAARPISCLCAAWHMTMLVDCARTFLSLSQPHYSAYCCRLFTYLLFAFCSVCMSCARLACCSTGQHAAQTVSGLGGWWCLGSSVSQATTKFMIETHQSACLCRCCSNFCMWMWQVVSRQSLNCVVV